jgi:tetratricopeptide (TPR) repeat protein/CHAT domain-containing protein
MDKAPVRLTAAISACLVLVFALPAHAQTAPSDEQAIQQLVARLFDARTRKDMTALSSLFSPKAPRGAPRLPAGIGDSAIMQELAKRIERTAFPYERLQLTRLTLSGLKQEATSMTAVATAQVLVTPTPTDKPRAETWIRNMGFVKEGDTWLIWRESPATDDLAVEIGRATSAEEREALLKANPQLVTAELALALEGQGDRLFTSPGRMRDALAFYQLELEIGEQAGAVLPAARAHLKIGQALQLNPGFAAALDEAYRGTAMDHFQKALEGFTAIGDREHMASAEVGMATVSYMRDGVAARDHYQKAIDILEGLPDTFVLANALHGLGNACFVIGDYYAALDAYRRSMSLQEAAGTRAGAPALWQAIGRVQKKLGDYDAALDSCRKSLENPASMDPGTLFDGHLEIADVYRLQGRFDLSLEQYGKALALVQTNNDDQGAMRVEADIGNLYMTEQQPAAALGHYQRSIELAQRLRNQDGVARALAGLGSAHLAEMDNEAALDAFSKALAIREGLNDKPNVAWLHAHIGLVHSASDRHEEALASFQKALDLSNELNDAAAIAVMQTLLAGEHADLDHVDQAIELAERAATVARAIESDDTLAKAKVIAARALRKKGDRDGAERALRDAVAAVESGRARTGDDARDEFFGDTRGPYREMALLLAEPRDAGKIGEALLFAERAHLDLLADILAGSRSLITTGLSPEEQEEERRLGRTLKSLRVQVDKERERPKPDPARLDSLRTKLTDAVQQRSTFDGKIYAAHPALKLQRGFFNAGTLADFSALVNDGKTVVVEFVTGEKQTLAVVLAKPAPRGKAAPSASEPAGYEFSTIAVDITLLDLTRRVRDYRTAIRTRDADIATPGQELYARLVEPWQHLLAGRTRVVIVPDGPLWSLPFQALQSADGRFLIERCAVSYAPSLTALTLVAGTSFSASDSPRTTRLVAIANRQAGSAAERLKLLNPAANLAPMPNAEQETRSLALLYGSSRARVYGGATATRDAIRTGVEAAAILHLATFFVPNAVTPMRSPIVFSIAKSGEAEVVEAWELMRAAMPPLAVVARVHVDRVGSDGTVPVGLSWVFFAAGTKTVVLATWPDDSPAAVSLMLGLHRNLSRPGTTAIGAGSALRQAILPLLAGKYRHPFYWANYSVIGM